MNSSWYQSIKKPSWAPPESLFGQVWSVLYIIIFLVNAYLLIMLARGEISWKICLPFWINLVANFLFTPLQFGLRNNVLAFIDIMIVLGTIVWAMWAIFPYNKYLAFAYVPYLLWVAIATVLQISITWLNR